MDSELDAEIDKKNSIKDKNTQLSLMIFKWVYYIYSARVFM